jgi:tetratricopeptide (TPR) repeat protein
MIKYTSFLIIIVVVLAFCSCSSSEKEEGKQLAATAYTQIILSDKQIDSLTSIMQESSLKNDTKKIDEIYNKYLKPNWKDTNNADFYLQRAHANALKLLYKEALKDILKAEKLNPTYAYVYYQKGLALGMLNPNAMDSSVIYFTKAIELDSNNTNYLQTRSETYNSFKKYDKAIEDINKAIKINQNILWFYALRASYLSNCKNYELALKDYNFCIQNKTQDDLFFGRGACYYFTGKYKMALIDFDKSIALNPNIGEYYTKRGASKFKLKNRDAAFEDFKKAMDLGDPEGTKLYNDCLIWYSKHKKI